MKGCQATTQFLSAICVNILTLSVGTTVTWTSPYLALFKSADSPLSREITDVESSWIGSLLAIGALPGCLIYGWISEKFGRLWGLLTAAFPLIIWWIITLASREVIWIQFGRFLAGLSAGGAFTLVPLYVSEISQDKLRGRLGSFFISSISLGMLAVYIAGDFFDYSTVNLAMLLLPIVFVVLFSFFKETPVFLLRQENFEQAEKSLRFLRGCDNDSDLPEEIKSEYEKLMKKVEIDLANKRESFLTKIKPPAVRKAFFIGIVLICIHQLSGIFVIHSYTSEIFIESGSNLSPNTSAVIVGSLLFLGSVFSFTVVDRFSRKSLYILTTVLNMLGLAVMGAFSYCKTITNVESFKFVPVVTLSITVFIVSVGRLPLTYIMMSEIMPQSIRASGVSICTAINWILAFILLKFFSSVMEAFGFHFCMFSFSLVTLFGFIFVAFYVPETKNKSFEEIERSMAKQTYKYNKTATNEPYATDKM